MHTIIKLSRAFALKTPITHRHHTHIAVFIQPVRQFCARLATVFPQRLGALFTVTSTSNIWNKYGCAGKRSHASNCKDDSKSVKSETGKSDVCDGKPGKWPTGKRANFLFHPETESILNEQLNAELKAFYYYLSMAAYFGQVDVALPGCESFFMQMHHEEHVHALKFMEYIKMRGGKIVLCPVYAPEDQNWECPLKAFKAAFELETEVTKKLVAVNSIAEKYNDLNASDFIVTGFMEDQMKSVNEMAKLVTVLSGVGDQALGRFLFDKDLLENHVMPEFNVLRNKRSDSLGKIEKK